MSADPSTSPSGTEDLLAAGRALLPRVWAGEVVDDEIAELLECAEERGDADGELAARFARTAGKAIGSEVVAARRAASELVQRAQALDRPLWESRGWQYLARMHLGDGHESKAIEELVTAELLTDAATQPSVLLFGALNGIAATYSILGLYEDAERLFARQEAMLPDIDEPWSHEALLYNRLLNWVMWALALVRTGAADEARQRLGEAIERSRRIPLIGERTSIRGDAELLELCGELLLGRVGVEEAMARLEASGSEANLEPRGYVRFALGMRLADVERFAEAREQVEAGLVDVHPIEGEPVHTALRWLRARVAVLEEPEHGGLAEAWAYIELTGTQFWELRLRRRDALRDRLGIQRLRRDHERVERASLEDHLTGLANRRALDLERTDLVTAPPEGWTTVAFVDIDGFKDVNDVYGHELGDEVLQHVAELLRSSTREGDLVGRYGGDEFVVLAPGCRPRDAEAMGERIVELVRAHDWTDLHEGLELSVSAGLASTVVAHERLFAAADEALYAAKEGGRDRAVTWVVDRVPATAEAS